MYANDITQFSSDENSSFLHTPSTSELQTSIELTRNTKVRESQNAQQISLLRKANTQRNGVYLMVVGNVIPIQRLAGNETIVGYSMGMGLRSGVISYLDNYIGIRGYFSLDFTPHRLRQFGTHHLDHLRRDERPVPGRFRERPLPEHPVKKARRPEVARSRRIHRFGHQQRRYLRSFVPTPDQRTAPPEFDRGNVAP